MMALVVLIAPDTSDTAVYIARVVGWLGARADDIATALFLGAGPLFISLAGHGDWVPRWLLRWSYLAFFCGLLSIVVLYFPGMSQYGFVIVPVGMGWMVAAGIVLLRKKTS
jgi:ABC-type transport system involved in cytochrome c biogenesis permease subunit